MEKFTRDVLITLIARISQLTLGLGTSIIIARVLGSQGKGIYSLAILLPILIVNFGNLGIGPASVFFTAKKKYSPKEILGTSVVLSFWFGVFGFLIGSIIVLFFSNSLFPGVARGYLFLTLFLIPLQFILNFGNHFLLGLQKIKIYNFINILQSFIFLTLLSVFLLVLEFDIKVAIAAQIMSYFVVAAILFFLVKRIVGSFHLRVSKSYLKDAFRYGTKVYLGNIIGLLHYRIDIFLINFFLNPAAVGFYSIAVEVSERLWLISQSAGTVIFPKVSSETGNKRLKELTPSVCRSVLCLATIGAFLLFFLGGWLIVFFYSKIFLDSVLSFRILLIGGVTMSGWRILADDLYGRGKPCLNIYISLASVVLNVILNIFWIPKYGIEGAAYATSSSYTLAFVMIVIVYSRISENKIREIVFVQKADFLGKNNKEIK